MDELTGMRLWAALVGIAALGGLVIYFGYGGWLYHRYYVKRRGEAEQWKIQAKRWASPKLFRWSVAIAACNMMIGGLLSGTFFYFVITHDFSALYFDVDEYGIVWTIASVPLMFLALEAAAYYTHRFLHGRFMFKHVHQWHHRLVAPTPFATVTMHPVEFTMLQATAFLPVMLLPVHWMAFALLLAYVLVFNIMDHSGIHMRHWLPWHSTSAFHDDHHLYFHCNYGQNLAVFDRFHGTHRRLGRRYGKDVFGGRGAPSGDGEAPGDFVKY